MRIVVTRALPPATLTPLAPLGEVWVSPHDRPLRPGELRDAVRGTDAVVTMLNDRVDEDVLAAAGPRLQVVEDRKSVV